MEPFRCELLTGHYLLTYLLNAFLAQAYGGLSRWQLRMKVLHVLLSSAIRLTLARDVAPLLLQLSLRQSVHRLGGRPLGRVPWTTPSSTI